MWSRWREQERRRGWCRGGTHPVEGDAVLLEDGRGDEGHLVSQEDVAALGAAREEAFRERQRTNVTPSTSAKSYGLAKTNRKERGEHEGTWDRVGVF